MVFTEIYLGELLSELQLGRGRRLDAHVRIGLVIVLGTAIVGYFDRKVSILRRLFTWNSGVLSKVLS